MATRGIRPVREHSLLTGWESQPERAPSVMLQDKPTLSRLVAGLGLFFALVGALAMLTPILREQGQYAIGPAWGFFFLTLGIALILQHAFVDRDMQFRRVYAISGLLLVGAGALLAILPHNEVIGGNFGRFGVPSLFLGWLFLLAVIRNETDVPFRNLLMLVMGGLGAAMIVVGLVGSFFSQTFLFGFGVPFVGLGLFYVTSFLGLLEGGDDRVYRAGLALGLAGAATFLLALIRSLLPIFAVNAPQYFLPAGLVLMAIGLTFAVVSLAICSDWPLIVLTRRELSSYLHSPIAYLLLAAITLLSLFMFSVFLRNIAEAPQPEPILQSYFVALFPVILLLFAVPILTMRLFSEEKRTGTLEVLLTAPVSDSAVIWSKFLAAWLFFVFTWLPLWLFLIALRWFIEEPFDYRPALSFMIALVTTGAGFMAMGLFFSSLTGNQIIAAVFTFMVMVGHLALYIVAFRMGPGTVLGATMNYLSFLDFWQSSLEGNLAPRYIVFQLSLACFFLYLTYKVLEARKWK